VIATGFEIGTAAADPMPKMLPKVAAAKAIDRRAIVCPFILLRWMSSLFERRMSARLHSLASSSADVSAGYRT
jgi:hypothetical protein